MQTVIILQITRFRNNKDLFIHRVIGETTGLLLVTVPYVVMIMCVYVSNEYNVIGVATELLLVTVQSAALLPGPSAFTFPLFTDLKQNRIDN